MTTLIDQTSINFRSHKRVFRNEGSFFVLYEDSMQRGGNSAFASCHPGHTDWNTTKHLFPNGLKGTKCHSLMTKAIFRIYSGNS